MVHKNSNTYRGLYVVTHRSPEPYVYSRYFGEQSNTPISSVEDTTTAPSSTRRAEPDGKWLFLALKTMWYPHLLRNDFK